MAFGVPCAAPLAKLGMVAEAPLAMLGMFAELAQGARAAPLAMLGMFARNALGALCVCKNVTLRAERAMESRVVVCVVDMCRLL